MTKHPAYLRRVGRILLLTLLLSALGFGGACLFARMRMLENDNAFLKDALEKQHASLILARKLDVTHNLATRYWFEDPPFLIFQDRFVPWSSLTRFLPDTAHRDSITPRLVGQFPAIMDAAPSTPRQPVPKA